MKRDVGFSWKAEGKQTNCDFLNGKVLIVRRRNVTAVCMNVRRHGNLLARLVPFLSSCCPVSAPADLKPQLADSAASETPENPF